MVEINGKRQDQIFKAERRWNTEGFFSDNEPLKVKKNGRTVHSTHTRTRKLKKHYPGSSFRQILFSLF